MTRSAALGPVALTFGAGVLAAALAFGLIGSPALIALAASLFTAAALAPFVAGMAENTWAERLVARTAEALGRLWPGFRLRSARDGRQRVFAFLVGLNGAVFASFFLRGGG
ncbi:MAG: hypothetical protein AAGG09_12735 [Pseudomonadota bacterium]